jgi:hypothetical protein
MMLVRAWRPPLWAGLLFIGLHLAALAYSGSVHATERHYPREIVIYYDASMRMVVTSPLGRRVAWDPTTRSVIKEIEAFEDMVKYPNEYPNRRKWKIWGEPAGRSTVTITGTVSGEFWLKIDTGNTEYTTNTFEVITHLGRTYTYTVDFSPEAGARNTVLPGTYVFGSFGPPLADGAVKTFRKGRAIPVTFTIARRDGQRADDVKARLFLLRRADDTPLENAVNVFDDIRIGMRDAVVPRSVKKGHKSNRFRYDPAKGRYVYQLATDYLEPGLWALLIHLDDGSVETARFVLK